MSARITSWPRGAARGALAAALLLASFGAAPPQERRLEHVKAAGGEVVTGSGRWAVIIGVDSYQSPSIDRLAGAVGDAQAIRDTLVKYADFPEKQVFLLTSESAVKPTTRAILTKLEEIRQATQPDDMLLFFFAGHGVEVDGQRYLLTYDADVAGPGALKATSLAATTLMQELETIRANHRVVMIDACRNDPLKGSRKVNIANESFEAAFTLQPAKESGVRATFLSCSKGQSAYEWTERRRGFFSYFIEKGLAGEAANRGKITLTSLIDYLNESVPQAVRQYRNRDQTPYTKFEGPPFVLVRGERLPVSVASLDRRPTLPTRMVYGVVKNSSGAPLKDAQVTVVVPAGTARSLVHPDPGPDKVQEVKVTTDEDGFFKVEGLPAEAKLAVTVAAAGHVGRTVPAPPTENGKKISFFLPSEIPTVPAARGGEPAKPALSPAPKVPEPTPKPKQPPSKPAEPPAKVAEPAPKADPAAKAAEQAAKAAEEARRAEEARKARAQELAAAAYRTFLVEDFREAEKLAELALKEDPEHALANAVLGNAMMAGVEGSNKQKVSQARAYVEKALKLDANLALAHNALGLTLVAAGDLAGGKASFEKGVKLDPKLGVAYGNLGYVHWQQKRYGEAERAYRMAASLNPESAIPYNGLSTVLHIMGRFGDAEKACRNAISRYQLRDEALGSFYVQLAVALFEQRGKKPAKREEALEAVARAKALGVKENPAYTIIEAAAKPTKG